jgi:hypothetical protein
MLHVVETITMTPFEAIVIGLGPFVLFAVGMLIFGMAYMNRIAHSAALHGGSTGGGSTDGCSTGGGKE